MTHGLLSPARASVVTGRSFELRNERLRPVKRSPLLIELSREHHLALVLATRLMPQRNAGYHAKLPDTAAERVAYLRDQFATHLSPHFGVEERAFALLAPGRAELDSAIARMLDDHREMRLMIQSVDSTGDDPALARFGRLLVGHVRFEERTLFPAVASQGSATELAGISDILSDYSQPGTSVACAESGVRVP